MTRLLRTDVARERAEANAGDDFIRTHSHTTWLHGASLAKTRAGHSRVIPSLSPFVRWNPASRDSRRPSRVVAAEDVAERHGEKADPYHDPRGPSVPQDAADDGERDS